MKKILLGAFAAAAVTTAFAPVASAATKLLGAPVHFQEQSQWCWNASSQMVMRFYDKYFTEQCELAEFGRKIDPAYWGADTCCLVPVGSAAAQCNKGNWLGGNHPAPLTTMLANYAVGATVTSSSITYAAVKTEIDNNHPMIMRWDWNTSGAHALVIRGYADAAAGQPDRVAYVDPWDDGAVLADYSTVVGCSTAACDHRWTETLKTTAPGANDSKVTLYSNSSYGGTATTVTTNTADLGANSNTTSSAKVRGLPYIFFDPKNYGSPSWSVVPGDYSSFTQWGETTDNQVSSVMRMPSDTERTAIVLFSGQNFTGSSVTLTADTATMPAGWNDNVSSLIVVNKIWQMYTNANYGGSGYAVTGFGGPNRDGFYPNPAAWGGPDNDASSARLVDPTGLPLLNPILLYENVDLAGRAVVLWDGSLGSNNLANLGFDNMTSAIRTYGGQWSVFENTNQGGSSSVLLPNHFYRKTADWGGAAGNDKITSVSYTATGAWRGSL